MRRVLYGLAVLLAIVQGTSWATTLTAGDILARARTYLRDQSTAANRQQFTDATLMMFLSDGQREADAQNWLLQACYRFNLTLGTTEYAAPDDFIATTRVWFQPPGSSYLKLDQTTMDQLDAQTSGWTNSKGVPTRYYLDKSTYSVMIGFWPAPSVANSTGPVVVYYVQQTKDITSTSDIPFNGNLNYQPYASALAYYVAYRGFSTVEETDQANVYLQYWLGFIQLMHQGMGKTPDYNPGFQGQHGTP